MMDFDDFGIYIREARKAAGFSQDKLAKKSKLSRAYINHIEAGRQPSLYAMERIARALHLTLTVRIGAYAKAMYNGD